MKRFLNIKFKDSALKSILPVIFFFLFHFSHSQTLNLNQFGIEEGLPQSSIYTMLQDKEGNIFVGTMNGISKYNGLSFENFNKSNGLAENRVTASCLDKNDNIWFGHWSGGITKYDAKTKKFSEVTTENIKVSKSITCMVCDQQGTIWFGTDGQGLLKDENGKFSLLTTKDGLASNEVNALMENIDGVLWIGTSNGINLKKTSLSTFDGNLPSKNIKSLFHDSKNNIWIGTSDQGVVRINSSDKQMVVYNTSKGLASNYVKTVFETNTGTIFIGTYGGGVSKYLPQLEANNYKGSIFQTISTQQGLSNDRVISIIQDREKNIWIGTLLNLNQYFDEQFEIYGENEGLLNSLVWSVIQDKKKNFWVGTEGGLVEFIHDVSKSNDNSEKTSSKKTLPGQLPSQQSPYRFIRHTGKEGQVLNTSALYEDAKGFIWYTDFGLGLSRLNPSNNEIKHFTTENGLPVNEIYCISGDNDGNIWVGTNKGGLLKYNLSSEAFEYFTVDNGLGSNQVYTIYRDSKNRMWFGTLSGNLSMFDPNNGKGKINFKTFSEADGYPSKFTLCITEDKQGSMWFGTFDKGVYKYDGKTFKNYSTKEGLSSNTPFLLVCDDNNNIWIGTGLGIDKFNQKDETLKHYEKEDGFLGIEINPNAACKDSDGNLWFGSIIGLVKYTNTKLEQTNLTEPITSIKNPRISFQNVEIPEDHVFPYTKNHFTFDFVGTSLTNPKRVKYRYMLEGVEKDWSPIVKTNSVTYPDLQPGKYTFKVRSCNNDGVWNKDPVTFQFVINPPFWKTTWFYLLSAIVVVGGLFAYVKVREKKLQAANIILEQKVVERTEVISKQKTEIEKKSSVITDSIEYARNIQQAILPSEEEINKQFSEYFILYKPKDIVSGDFYWMHEDKDRVLLAVADCTGHGVPGAFVSLMGHNLLNDTVNVKGKSQPAEVLDELNVQILRTLKQKNTNASAKYGMDISLISLDKKMRTLEFAGAHNPLLVLRNHECIEIKADRRAIGNFKKANQPDFANQAFPLMKGDMLYMFSDGYCDQIGGPDNKKFFSQPFRELLATICELDPQQQKKVLEETTVNWRGKRIQMDDILVFGIRV